MKTFKNQTVKVEDPQGIFEEGREYKSVTAIFNKEKKVWLLKLPEGKKKDDETESKAESLGTSPHFKIRATIAKDGKPKLSWTGNNRESDMVAGIERFLEELKSMGKLLWSRY